MYNNKGIREVNQCFSEDRSQMSDNK